MTEITSDGGIGIHKGLKIPRLNRLASSSLAPRTILLTNKDYKLNFQESIKQAFEEYNFLSITIKNHVSGFRVSLYDADVGEICSCTGGDLEKTYNECAKHIARISEEKLLKKIELLEKKKNMYKEELDMVEKELSTIKLGSFKPISN